MTPDDPRHGTVAGYQKHRRDRETACQECKDAVATYQRHRDYEQVTGRARSVPAHGARRRIRALYRLGWTAQDIADLAGYKDARSIQKITGLTEIHRTTHNRIDRAYRKLCMKLGPSNGTRAHATRLNYAPPMAWDDIDNPNEKPKGIGRARSQ